MAMASLTSGLLARKGQARPSSHKAPVDFRFENDDAVELLLEEQRVQAASMEKKPSRTDAEVKADAKAAEPRAETGPATKPVARQKPAFRALKKKPEIEATGSEEVARKTVRIRTDLDTELRLYAAHTHMSQKDIIEAALTRYLDEERVDLPCICSADG